MRKQSRFLLEKNSFRKIGLVAKPLGIFLALAVLCSGCVSKEASKSLGTANSGLRVEQDEETQSIKIYRADGDKPMLTHMVESDFRPYLHPIEAPDGKGEITEYSPGHHKHQTGLYWGFTRVNGRDYFHNPGEDHWRRISAKVLEKEGDTVSWQTVYDLLDERGNPVLTETQNWFQ
jgi:hypothetical protein